MKSGNGAGSLECVSTDNCRLLGTGRSSEVFQLSSDAIVKRYYPHVPMQMIEREMALSKKAFEFGIPTPCPLCVAKVDSSYGIIFKQTAPAISVGESITADKGRFDEITKRFTALLKQLHRTRVEESVGFPSMNDTWIGWAEGMRPFYSEKESHFLQEMVEGVPYRHILIHCDFHENNVLLCGNDLILIDMADIGYGHPIFDLACGAFRAHVSLIPERKAHHGMSAQDMQLFWQTVLEDYFETDDTEVLRQIQEMCSAFGFLRSALFPMKHIQISPELRQLHIDDARRNLFPRREWALRQVESLARFFPECEHAQHQHLAGEGKRGVAR